LSKKHIVHTILIIITAECYGQMGEKCSWSRSCSVDDLLTRNHL